MQGINGRRTLSLDKRLTVLFGWPDSQVFHAFGRRDSPAYCWRLSGMELT
jgi:hypothetical protein